MSEKEKQRLEEAEAELASNALPPPNPHSKGRTAKSSSALAGGESGDSVGSGKRRERGKGGGGQSGSRFMESMLEQKRQLADIYSAMAGLRDLQSRRTPRASARQTQTPTPTQAQTQTRTLPRAVSVAENGRSPRRRKRKGDGGRTLSNGISQREVMRRFVVRRLTLSSGWLLSGSQNCVARRSCSRRATTHRRTGRAACADLARRGGRVGPRTVRTGQRARPAWDHHCSPTHSNAAARCTSVTTSNIAKRQELRALAWPMTMAVFRLPFLSLARELTRGR